MSAMGISRRTVLAGALGFALAGCRDDAEPTAAALAPTPTPAFTPAPTKPGGWSEITPWPYAPWLQALTAWTGTDVLVFGGADQVGGPAPELQVENAAGAFDIRTGTWRALTVAPFRTTGAKLVSAGDRAFAVARDYNFANGRTDATHLWEYTTASDSWRELPSPPDPRVTDLAVTGDQLVVWARFTAPRTSAPVQLYDIATNVWRDAPTTPGGLYRGRSVLALDDGRLVVLEKPGAARSGAGYWSAALLEPGSNSWQHFPSSTIPVSDLNGVESWTAVGPRIVNADPRSQSVGGREVSLGGILSADTGRWSSLPSLPGKPHVHQGSSKYDPHPDVGWNTRDVVRAIGGDYSLAYGWAFEARTKGWCEMPVIPRDRNGLDNPAAVWVDDRLLLWSNAKVDPIVDPNGEGFGYRIKPEQVGWAWSPLCATGMT